MSNPYKDLLAKVQDTCTEAVNREPRVLVIDALNLFFRNFATINITNRDGTHIGGLAGFIRSLGSLVGLVQPTSVYVIFDGAGSSTNRKNLVTEYKSNRGIHRITNWDIFEDLQEEDEAKVNQITRLIHYLQCLPVKIITVDKAEADDVIAYLAQILPKQDNSEVVIVSTDKDYLQLVNDKVVVYRPTVKTFYTPEQIRTEFKILPDNFLIYKTLLGDSADKIDGIKGLGPKTLIKLFPDMQTVPLKLKDVFDYCEDNLEQHKIYPTILLKKRELENHYKIMDLHNPILDDRQIEQINRAVQAPLGGLYKKQFLELYSSDGIGTFIKNIDWWVSDTFFDLSRVD